MPVCQLMKRIFPVLFALVLVWAAVPAVAQEKSLYQRLGGYDALDAVSADLEGRLGNDPQLGVFFKGHSADSLKRLHQLLVEFLCEASGGPCTYLGRDMKTAHKGLGISESDWQLTMKHLEATLDKFKVPKKERGEVIAFISSLKGDIVEK